MGDVKAGYMLLTFVIIFFIITTILVSFGVASQSTLETITGLNAASSCQSPRSYYNSFGNELNVLATSPFCSQTKAIDQETCNDIAGCEWKNTTTWFFFKSTEQSCQGKINKTAYNSSLSYNALVNVCDLAGLQDDAYTCELIGCTYNDGKSVVTENTTFGEIISIFGTLFALSYDFGTNSTMFNAILTFFVFYVPLIAIIIAGYFSLPFIHG